MRKREEEATNRVRNVAKAEGGGERAGGARGRGAAGRAQAAPAAGGAGFQVAPAGRLQYFLAETNTRV